MSGLFGGGPSIPVPPPPPEMPAFPEFPEIEFPEFPEFPVFDPEAGEAKRRREEEIAKTRQIQRLRKGYGSTLLTTGKREETPPSELSRPALIGR